MPNFMRQHGLQFRLGELRHEGVEQNDFSKTPEPCEERVGVARAFAAIHHFDTARGKVGALCQSKEALAQCSFRQRRELVEQRHDHRRRDEQQEQLKCDDNCRRPKPPRCAGPLNQFQHQRKQRIAKHRCQQKSFHAIKHPRFHCRGVETKSRFEFELRVPGERQCEDA